MFGNLSCFSSFGFSIFRFYGSQDYFSEEKIVSSESIIAIVSSRSVNRRHPSLCKFLVDAMKNAYDEVARGIEMKKSEKV